MKNKYSILIVPSDHKRKTIQLQFSVQMKQRILTGAAVFGILFSFIIAHDLYQLKYIKTHQHKYAYIDQLESELQAKKLEIARLNGKVAEINADLLSIASLQDQVVAILGLDGAAARSSSGELSRGAAPQVSRTAAETLDGASLQIQAYLTSMQTYYDATLAYDDKLRRTPNILPVNGQVSSFFGYRRNPFGGRSSEFHDGVDFSVRYGTAVRVPADGTVISARYESGWGYRIDINHGYGTQTFYAHLSRMTVKSGQKVTRSEIIGYTGNSGRSTGTHLHYGASVNGRPVDPLMFTSTETKS